jgi:glycosyltransferase involved in cell wall biosynthesis
MIDYQARAQNAVDVSVVVPVLDEEDSVEPLALQIRDAMADSSRWELLFVDDGSRDSTAARVAALESQDHRIRLIRLARCYGQATAMQAGFDHARGRYVVTMDGDLQNDPRDIPQLLAKIEEGFDLVAGFRQRRQDRLITRKIPSKVANYIIRRVTGVPIRDNGCSLKAYTRALLDQVRLYSDMHRFIPALAAGVAGARIAEVPVRHHPRRHGSSKYGLSRVAKVIADLATVKMIRSFRLRPLLLYSVGAAAAGMVGALATALAILARAGSAENVFLVYPGVALMAIALAFYLLMLGLVGEVIVRRAGGDRHRLPLLHEPRHGVGE